MTETIAVSSSEEQQELSKIKECLKQADKSYYHRILQNRMSSGNIFPHLGEDGKLFLNTFQYVNLFKEKF